MHVLCIFNPHISHNGLQFLCGVRSNASTCEGATGSHYQSVFGLTDLTLKYSAIDQQIETINTEQHLTVKTLLKPSLFQRSCLVHLELKIILAFQVRGAERGDIKLSFRYYEGESQLIVKVIECKGLRPFPGRVSCSEFSFINQALCEVPHLLDDRISIPTPVAETKFGNG